MTFVTAVLDDGLFAGKRAQRRRSQLESRMAVVLGKVILVAGGILVLGAVFGRAALMNLNAERAQAKLPALRTLGEAYPQYPTWLVPEGPWGFSISALLVLGGMAITLLAEKARKR